MHPPVQSPSIACIQLKIYLEMPLSIIYGPYFVPKIQLQLQASTFAFELPHSTVYICLLLARLFRHSYSPFACSFSLPYRSNRRRHSSFTCSLPYCSDVHIPPSAVCLSLATYCFVFHLLHTTSSFACRILLRRSHLSLYGFGGLKCWNGMVEWNGTEKLVITHGSGHV